MGAMVLYYRFFHSKGPIVWKDIIHDVELNNKSVMQNTTRVKNQTSLKYIRAFKNLDNTNATHDQRYKNYINFKEVN